MFMIKEVGMSVISFLGQIINSISLVLVHIHSVFLRGLEPNSSFQVCQLQQVTLPLHAQSQGLIGYIKVE